MSLTICHLQNLKTFLTTDGLKVLGIPKAKNIAKGLPEVQNDFSFKFIGLIGLSVPIRKNINKGGKICE